MQIKDKADVKPKLLNLFFIKSIKNILQKQKVFYFCIKIKKMFRKLDYRYIYVLGNWAYPFRYKIGIAHDVKKRKDGIDKSMRGRIYDLFWIKVMFAMRIEQFLHWFYAPLSARMKGSGKTEWFWMIFPVTPILLL